MASRIFPAELDFLQDYEVTENLFRRVSWRESAFEDPVWTCKFGRTLTRIDFRVQLEDGSSLTDRRHRQLLESIKTYLCIQTHPYSTERKVLSHNTEKILVSIAIHVVDYFLLRSKQFHIAVNGFSAVLREDVARFVVTTGQKRTIKASLYNVEDELIRFFRHQSAIRRPEQRGIPPGLYDVDVERTLPLSDDEICRAREFLWRRGFYSYASRTSNNDAKYRVRSQALLMEIYRGRVIGNLKFDYLPLGDFEFGNSRSYVRELPHVSVRTNGEMELASEEYVAQYAKALRSMALAGEHGYPLIESEALSVLNNKALFRNLDTKERGRFVTLDFEVASKALRDAINFILEYGEDLVASYLACVAAAIKNRTTLSRLKDITQLLRPRIRAMGVIRWRLPTKDGINQYVRMRNNEALYELLLILYGSSLIVINTLMARRVKELLSLKKDSWWRERSGWQLNFDLGKANVGELRKLATRPLPSIGAQVFNLLKQLQDGLSILGIKFGADSILAPPHFSQTRLAKATVSMANTSLDYFCDYTQTATDSVGRRHYIRNHQLRRNFVMLLFWQDKMGGIEVLRWFLGHTRPSHIYRYLSETIPGAVLRRVKAERVAHDAREGELWTQPLTEFMATQYGITDVSIMPVADVADYIESLMIEGSVRIEPEFFESPTGHQRLKILIKISERSNA